MLASRRTSYNFGLQRAVDWAAHLRRPLVILEVLPLDYPWASDRLHAFLLQGMADVAIRLKDSPARYYPFVETESGQGLDLITALAARACVVVTDRFPLREHEARAVEAERRVPVLFEDVDSCGLLPLRAATKVFATAHSFRRFLQKALPEHLRQTPHADPLRKAELPALRSLPREITRRWPPSTVRELGSSAALIAKLPIDHDVPPVPISGGQKTAGQALRTFVKARLSRYEELRNEPERDATSGLSPYLHFGHISVHQALHEIARHEDWSVDAVARDATGKRAGWWGMSASAEAFLDQLVTWRELGFNFCSLRDDYDRFESLPPWARRTLSVHARDIRPRVYPKEQLEAGQTHDPLWNAAQMQLVREGRLHNYLRMLWGKKILEWSASPERAAEVMIELNDRYALDGRDPNSYSGIFWVLGRYDRPWGPERSVFGTIRYMSSENTARKVRVKNYIREYAP